MFCYLFDYLSSLDIPGMGVFKYISFRSSLAFISSLLIATIIGRKIIDFLQKNRSERRYEIWIWPGRWQKKELQQWVELSLSFRY